MPEASDLTSRVLDGSHRLRAYERFSQAVELPMLVLALLFVPVIAVPLLFNVTEAVEAALLTATWMIWAAFVVATVAGTEAR